MSEIIEQEICRKITPCGWNANEILLAVIRCPIRNIESDVLNRMTGCHH
jgi:hypothetical protein